MKNRATLILFGLFLGGLILLWSLNGRRRSGPLDTDSTLVTAVSKRDEASIKTIELTGSKDGLRFERRGANWQFVRPIDALADRSKIHALISSVRKLSARPDAGEIPGPASKYGLQPPRRTITLHASAGEEPPLRLKLGEARRGFIYVQVNDDSVIHIVADSGLNPLPLDPVDWRARAPFPVPSHEVESLTFEENGRKFTVAHKVGTWKIVAPFSAPAEDPKVENLVSAVIGLHVAGEKGFLAEDVSDLKPYGLDPPRARIELTAGQKTPVTDSLRIGDPIPGRPGLVYALFGDQDDVVAIDLSGIPPFETLPLDVRSTEVADVDFDTASHLQVKTGNLTYVLTRNSQGWTQSAPVSIGGDSRVILEYLAHIGGLHALKIVPEREGDENGLNDPAAVIQIWHGDWEKSDARRADVTLKLGRFDPSRQILYAQIDGEPNVLSLPASARALIPEGPLQFADRRVHTLAPGSIDQLIVRHGGKSVTLKASEPSPTEERWSMVQPIVAKVDPMAVNALDNVLSNLRAESRLPEKVSTKTGLDHPWMEIQWRLIDGETGSLTVGAPVASGNGARYARSSLAKAPFTLSKAVLAVLDAELHDRTVLRIPEKSIQSIAILREGYAAEWKREPRSFQEARWVPDPAQDETEVSVDAVRRLAAALEDLRTSRFVQYQGAFEKRWGLDRNALVIEIRRTSEQEPRRLRVGSAVGSDGFAATTSESESGSVFLLPGALIVPLTPAAQLPPDVFETN